MNWEPRPNPFRHPIAWAAWLADEYPALFMWLVVLPIILLAVGVLSALGVGFGDSYSSPANGGF